MQTEKRESLRTIYAKLRKQESIITPKFDFPLNDVFEKNKKKNIELINIITYIQVNDYWYSVFSKNTWKKILFECKKHNINHLSMLTS